MLSPQMAITLLMVKVSRGLHEVQKIKIGFNIMTITASMVKELRERSGAGMMDCKKALEEVGGDLEAAIEFLRKSGIAKAAKKAGRTAAEGLVLAKQNEEYVCLVEINCETDFVANDENFRSFAELVAENILAERPEDLEALKNCSTPKGLIEEMATELSAKVGEKIDLRRFVTVEKRQQVAGIYLHGNKIGVITLLDSSSEGVARDIAMHIAATNPLAIGSEDLQEDVLEKEREIHRSQAEETGKSPEIIEKMVSGKMKKFIAENTLLGQNYVKDNEKTVAAYLDETKSSISKFYRFEVGEGVEKKTVDFAEEVAAQAQNSGGS